jgi:glutathione peroxidase
MRTYYFSLLALLILGAACAPDKSLSGLDPIAEATDNSGVASRGVRPTANASVYPFRPLSITGQPVSLAQYRGRKILIVNVASYCTYTPQYRELEQLWQQYHNRVVVLGFPCNQFGGQEPGNDSTINSFCTGTYNITFPLFHKIEVTGVNADPLYKFLADRRRNGVNSFAPSWNFCKYLIDERGFLIGYYPSTVSPLSPTLLDAILQ